MTRVKVKLPHLLAIVGVTCVLLAAPRSADAQCVTVYVQGDTDGASVWGMASIGMNYWGCQAEGYTLSGYVDIIVSVGGPSAWADAYSAGYGWAVAETGVSVVEYGTYGIGGWGNAYYNCEGACPVDYYYDETYVNVSPPVPTISLSADRPIATYGDTYHVTVTATVTPPGMGYEAALQWNGGYAGETNLQRMVSTGDVGTFPVTAYIGGTSANTSVEVQPALGLTPLVALAYVGESDVVITAEVSPPSYASSLQFNQLNGAGFTSGLERLVSTETPGPDPNRWTG